MKSWCIPKPSARFVAQMEDILDVYQQPYDPKRPQVCLDEIQKVFHSTPLGELVMTKGKPRREDYEYERHGQCALFLAVEPLAGFRKVWARSQRTKLVFAEILKELVGEIYPEADKIVLVTDNLNIHHSACLYERYHPEEAHRIAARIEWHFTPVHASWLNIAECELSVLKRQCLNIRIATVERVTAKTTSWASLRNTSQTGINWRFSNQDARIKLKRLYPVVNVQKST